MATTVSISKRVADSKRHTLGYVLRDGREITRSQAVKMAQRNQIKNVRAINGSDGPYIQSVEGAKNLYDLPVTIRKGKRGQMASRKR